MPFALVEAAVALVAPDGRRRLALLAERVHSHEPEARRVASDGLNKLRLANQSGRGGQNLPGAFQLVDAITGNGLLGIGVPLEFRGPGAFAAEDVDRPGGNRERVG